MKTKVTGRLSRILFRLYIYLRNKFDPPKVISEEELTCYKICHKLITNQNSKLFVAPLSYKRYIKNDEKNMFLVIEHRSISLINHVYSYTVYCEDAASYEQMISHFDQELEQKRIKLEMEIKSNIRHSLKTICDSIS